MKQKSLKGYSIVSSVFWTGSHDLTRWTDVFFAAVGSIPTFVSATSIHKEEAQFLFGGINFHQLRTIKPHNIFWKEQKANKVNIRDRYKWIDTYIELAPRILTKDLTFAKLSLMI